MKGWQCPACKKCYAPWVKDCDCQQVKQDAPEPQYQPAKRCLACGGYHEGLSCPFMQPNAAVGYR